MRIILLSLLLVITKLAFAQEKEIITVIGFRTTYTLADNKIYEDTTENPVKLVAMIKGNQIVRLDSTNPKDILYTVVNEKVYRTADTAQQNLLLYIKGQKVLLRTKKGTFECAGGFVRKGDSKLTLLGYLEPLEYFAFLIAANEIDN